MAVDSPNSATGAPNPNAASAATSAAKSALGSKEFLTLMVAQMKNQDPFKPQDPTAFLGQLAQFSTVSGIQDMQGSLTTLSDALRSSQVLGGSTLVGHEVLADADSAALGATGDVKGSVTIPEGATNAMVVVTDSSGQLVRRVQLSSQQGAQDFTWDGHGEDGATLPPGKYSISSTAIVDGAPQTVTTYTTASVDGVSLGANGSAPMIDVGALGQVSMSDIFKII